MRESGLFKRKKRLKEQHELKGRKPSHHMSCNELYSKCQLLHKSQHRREPVYSHERQEVVCQTVVKSGFSPVIVGKRVFLSNFPPSPSRFMTKHLFRARGPLRRFIFLTKCKCGVHGTGKVLVHFFELGTLKKHVLIFATKT